MVNVREQTFWIRYNVHSEKEVKTIKEPAVTLKRLTRAFALVANRSAAVGSWWLTARVPIVDQKVISNKIHTHASFLA